MADRMAAAGTQVEAHFFGGEIHAFRPDARNREWQLTVDFFSRHLAPRLIGMRPALENDKPYLVWLEEACMREYAVALWGEWPPELGVRTTVAGCRIIMVDGKTAGCVTTEALVDHLWLDELFIAPTFQRLGVGSHILKQVVSEAKRVSLPLRLSVLTTNPAIAFYLRHGLRVRERTAERIYLTSELPVRRPTSR
ncbi:GNAT family N-acetyltransferase [Lichenifustis flavocetrariae]|uniref:GNAT family N-acetyltransferase n=1 Tax=Lichenifustis flavocetrariae TaxID=2949735 RepID=A0AA41Z0S3_9HYPH|nr:GNAT family N-acetyltransferase [Lichenifustis flavocetrariae]MCW6512081.1 GNAT family N-acetyltransferase [Lichenifustis flavocetrariae]